MLKYNQGSGAQWTVQTGIDRGPKDSRGRSSSQAGKVKTHLTPVQGFDLIEVAPTRLFQILHLLGEVERPSASDGHMQLAWDLAW